MKTLLLTCLFAVTVGLFAGCSKAPDSSAPPPAPPPQSPPPSATHTNAN